MQHKTWLGTLTMMAVSALLSVACGSIASAPTATAAPTGMLPTSVPPAAAPTGQPGPTARPTEATQLTPEATPPGIPYLASGAQVEIQTVQMIDPLVGWGIASDADANDHVLKTGDGGRTWQDVTPSEPAVLPPVQESSALMFFRDAQQGWVVYLVDMIDAGPVRIHFWSTTDGGRSWSRAPSFDSTGEPEAPPILIFSDASTGWLLSDQFVGMGHHALTLLQTQDGGSSWVQLAGPPESESTCHRTGLSFSNSSHGWMTGECPFDAGAGASLEISDDGGSTWNTVTLPPPATSPDVFRTASVCRARSPHLFAPEVGALLVTCSVEAAGAAQDQSFKYSTTDGGATWQTSSFPGGELYLLDPSRGWALSKRLNWTEDGGATWTEIKTVEWEGQFSFVSDQLGWAVARNADEVALVATTDGGRTWELLEPIISP